MLYLKLVGNIDEICNIDWQQVVESKCKRKNRVKTNQLIQKKYKLNENPTIMKFLFNLHF